LSDALFRARIVFWDFDGVIKESVAVKTDAFGLLFSQFGSEVVDRVKDHHLANGGISRFEKIPVYLAWAGQPVTEANVEDYCQRFSQAVLQCVVAAPWVPGVEHYLRTNPNRQEFVLVTATPQREIEDILQAIDLRGCFFAVYGAPTRKVDAICQTLSSKRDLFTSECLMIGDSTADLEAATQNNVPFLLRRHIDNQRVFHDYVGASIKDFSGL
jgi:phosphoglycolate phosphatase-like HAD superfamily hydrolase